MNRKRALIFTGMFVAVLMTMFIYVFFGPKTNDIIVSNETNGELKNLNAYLTVADLDAEGSPSFVLDGIESGESILLASFSILEDRQSKTAIYGGEIPFEGDVLLVYEDSAGNIKTDYADGGHIDAQTSGNHVKFTIE